MSSYYSRYGRSGTGSSRLHDSDVGGGAEPSYSSHLKSSPYRASSNAHDSRGVGGGHRPYHRSPHRAAPPPPPAAPGVPAPIAPGELLVCPMDDDDDACSALTELTEQIPSPTSSNRRSGRNFRPTFRSSFMSTLNEDDDGDLLATQKAPTSYRERDRGEPRSADRLEARSDPRADASRSARRSFEPPSTRLELDDPEPPLAGNRFTRDRGAEDDKPLVSNYMARRNRARDEPVEVREPVPPPRTSRYLDQEDPPHSSRGALMSPKFEERRSSAGRYQPDDMDDCMSVHSSARDRMAPSNRASLGDPGARRRTFNEDRHQNHHDSDEMSVHSSFGRDLAPSPVVIAFDEGVGVPDRGAPRNSTFNARGDSSVYSHSSRMSSAVRHTSAASRNDVHDQRQSHQDDTPAFTSPRLQRQPSVGVDTEKYETEIKELEGALAEKTDDVQGLHSKIKGLEQEMQERLDRREEEIDRMKRSEDQNKADLKKVEVRLKSAQEENLDARQDIAQMREDLDKASHEAEKHIKAHQAETQLMDTEYKREIEALQRDLEHAHHTLDEKEENMRELQKQLEGNEAEQKAEVEDLTVQVKKLEDMMAKKDGEIADLHQKESELHETVNKHRLNDEAKTEQLEQEMKQLKDENENIRHMTQSYETTLKRNQSAMDSLEKELDKKESQVKDLERKREELEQSGDYDRCMLDRYRASAENLQRQLDREKRDKETMKSFLQSEIDLLKKDKQRMTKDFERELQDSKTKSDVFQRPPSKQEHAIDNLQHSFEGASLSGPADSYGDSDTAGLEWDPTINDVHVEPREVFSMRRYGTQTRAELSGTHESIEIHE